MPAPTQDTNYVAEGNALLTSRYRNAKVTAGIVKALMLRYQEVENSLWALLNGALLANAPMAGGPWDIYDKIGAIVGVAREGRTDAQYIPAIALQIRINRSQGLSEDLIQIVALVVTGALYYDWPPATWEVDVFLTTVDVIAALKRYLPEASDGGVAGNLRYTVTGWGTPVVTPGDKIVGTGNGFGDKIAGATTVLTSLEKIK